MARRLPNLLPTGVPEAMAAAARRPRDRLLVLVLVYAGLRNAEACALDVPDLDLDLARPFLSVRHGKGDKPRVIPLPRWLAAELTDWLAGRQMGPLFCSQRKSGRLTPGGLRRLIKRLAIRAGLVDARQPRRYHPHALRHYFASWLLETGASIAEVRDLLGHASIATTDVYTHCRPERLRAAVERLSGT